MQTSKERELSQGSGGKLISLQAAIVSAGGEASLRRANPGKEEQGGWGWWCLSLLNKEGSSQGGGLLGHWVGTPLSLHSQRPVLTILGPMWFLPTQHKISALDVYTDFLGLFLPCSWICPSGFGTSSITPEVTISWCLYTPKPRCMFFLSAHCLPWVDECFVTLKCSWLSDPFPQGESRPLDSQPPGMRHCCLHRTYTHHPVCLLLLSYDTEWNVNTLQIVSYCIAYVITRGNLYMFNIDVFTKSPGWMGRHVDAVVWSASPVLPKGSRLVEQGEGLALYWMTLKEGKGGAGCGMPSAVLSMADTTCSTLAIRAMGSSSRCLWKDEAQWRHLWN